jgi:type IV pilus assembly protein PilM
LEETEAAGETTDATTTIPGPTGPGWVVEMKGYHYFKNDRKSLRVGGANHVRNNFLRLLEEGTVELPVENGARTEKFTMKEMGIQFPILASDEGEPVEVTVPNPDVQPTEGDMQGGVESGADGTESYSQMTPSFGPRSGPGVTGPANPAANGAKEKTEEEQAPPFFKVRRYGFTIQFCWQEKRLSERLKIREEEEAKKKAEAAANPPPEPTNAAEGTEAVPAPDPNAGGAPANPVADPQDATPPDPAAQPNAAPAEAAPPVNGGQPAPAAEAAPPNAAPVPANAAPDGPAGAN